MLKLQSHVKENGSVVCLPGAESISSVDLLGRTVLRAAALMEGIGRMAEAHRVRGLYP